MVNRFLCAKCMALASMKWNFCGNDACASYAILICSVSLWVKGDGYGIAEAISMHRCVSIAFIVSRSTLFHFSISHFCFMLSLSLPSCHRHHFFSLALHLWVCVARHQRCHAIRMPFHVKSQQRHTTCLWQFPFCSKHKCITNWFESFSSCLSCLSFFLLHHSQCFFFGCFLFAVLLNNFPGCLCVSVCRTLYSDMP